MSHIEDSPAVSFPLGGRLRAKSSRKDTQTNSTGEALQTEEGLGGEVQTRGLQQKNPGKETKQTALGTLEGQQEAKESGAAS